MKVYLISDTHFNHDNIKTYCDRPDDYHERIIRNWRNIVKPDDTIIHVGDVIIGKSQNWDTICSQLPGRKILVRGNHDEHHSCNWWMQHGFVAASDAMLFRGAWITHKPSGFLPAGAFINIHGHLHNIFHGFHNGDTCKDGGPVPTHLNNPWQRLFAVEYTDYRPVEFDKFVNHPTKYLATGLTKLF